MNNENCPHCKSSETEKSFLISNEHWRAFLADEQSYLGRCIVELKEHKGSLADLTSDEWNSLGEIIKKIENCLTKVFGVVNYNWTFMVNDAYKEINPQPHVHWHVRPRYSKEVILDGKKYSDPDFGKHYDRERRDKSTDIEIQKIKEKMLNYL